MGELDLMLEKFQVECDDFIIRCRRKKQTDEEFRYKMLHIFNTLNNMVPILLNHVDTLINGIKDSTINSMNIEAELNKFGVAANTIIQKCREVQSSMARDNYYKRDGVFDEYGLLYSMVNTMNDIVGRLIRMVGSLTVTYSNSLINEKALSDQLAELESSQKRK